MPDIILLPISAIDEITLHPFDAEHPLPPTALVATYTTDPRNRNNRRIKLTWTPVAAQPDVEKFFIYRNDSRVGEVLTSATEPNEFIDDASGGEVDYFTYFITAVDNVGIEGPISDSICNFSTTLNKFIEKLRTILKDKPTDPRVRRWTDDELLISLEQSISQINSTPMNTDFNFDSAPKDLFNLILTGGRIYSLQNQAGLEAAKESALTVGGISARFTRAGIYNQIAGREEQAWQKQVDRVKLNFTMRTVFGEGLVTSPLPFRIRTFAPRQFRIR